MSSYHRNNDLQTFTAIVCVLLAFVVGCGFGYWVRDKGFVVRIDSPKIEIRRLSK